MTTPPLALSLPGVRFTPHATVALAAIPSGRRSLLLRALRELAAVASLALHGGHAGIMESVPLELVAKGVRARYSVAEDNEIVVHDVSDDWQPGRRIV